MDISEIEEVSPSMVSMYYLRQMYPTLQDCERLAIEIESDCGDRRRVHLGVIAPSVADGRVQLEEFCYMYVSRAWRLQLHSIHHRSQLTVAAKSTIPPEGDVTQSAP